MTRLDKAVEINQHGQIKETRPLPISIGMLWKYRNSYDLKAPYQRDSVWRSQYKIALIRSIIYKRPIPAIYTSIDKHKPDKKYVIDGKQRLTTIFGFMDNKIKIPIIISGELTELLYCDIEKRANAGDTGFKRLLMDWENYSISEIIYEGLSMEDQIELFGEINAFEKMTTLETEFGTNYYCRQLFDLIYAEIEESSSYLTHSRQKIKSKKRDGIGYFLSRITYVCFGSLFNDVWAPRNLSMHTNVDVKGSIRAYLKDLHTYLLKFITNKGFEIYDRDRFKLLPFYPQIKILINACVHLAKILDSSGPNVPKFLHQNDLLYITMLMLEYIRNDMITFKQLKDQKKVFYNVIRDFTAQVRQMKDGMQAATVAKKRDLFRKILIDNNVDFDIKNNTISDDDKTQALLNADSTSPISGENITVNNIQFDHVKPKSKHAESAVRVLTADDNQMKSALSGDQAKAIADYCGDAE